jgi:hypothetical protein
MRRANFDEDTPMPPHGRAPALLPEDVQMPCQRCGTSCTRKTLSIYGGRCFGCFTAYCQEPQPSPNVGDKRVSVRDWARALQARKDAGERLTPAQLGALRTMQRKGGISDGHG